MIKEYNVGLKIKSIGGVPQGSVIKPRTFSLFYFAKSTLKKKLLQKDINGLEFFNARKHLHDCFQTIYSGVNSHSKSIIKYLLDIV